MQQDRLQQQKDSTDGKTDKQANSIKQSCILSFTAVMLLQSIIIKVNVHFLTSILKVMCFQYRCIGYY